MSIEVRRASQRANGWVEWMLRTSKKSDANDAVAAPPVEVAKSGDWVICGGRLRVLCTPSTTLPMYPLPDCFSIQAFRRGRNDLGGACLQCTPSCVPA